MAELFQLDLVTPEKLYRSSEISMVVVPGEQGDFGVMANHAPFISKIRPGVIEIYEESTSEPTDRYFVTEGYAETHETHCTVLAEELIDVTSLERAEISDDIEQLHKKINIAEHQHERSKLEKALYIAEAKLEAALG
jgi:F-type H+-transporting ATPase subunit epsilon